MKRSSKSHFIYAVLILALGVLACGSSADTPPAAPTTPPQPTAIQELPTPTHSVVKPVLTREGLEGTFNISGTNPDGSSYTGTLNLKLNDSYTSNDVKVDVYDATWGDGSIGTGILIANMLATSFGGGECGAVFYAIDTDFSLAGLWLSLDTKQIGTENATPAQARNSLDGAFQLVGSNPDGSQYQGTLTLIPQGDVWQLVWDIDGSTTDGVGINASDLFAAAYGGQGCGVGLYSATADNSLSGVWAIWGNQNIGTETAIKQ